MISNMLRFPFSMLDDEMDDLFYPNIFRNLESSSRANNPAINVGTTDKGVDVYAFVPGMKPDELDIAIEKNMLSVAGTRKLPAGENGNDASYREERFSGDFKRVITLPESVEADKAEAVYKEGVLHISIAKRAEIQPQPIKISVQ